MGTKGTKKGGLKSSRVRKIGPRLMINSMHEDRRPVQVVVQVSHLGDCNARKDHAKRLHRAGLWHRSSKAFELHL
jgi:hypothetical protein